MADEGIGVALSDAVAPPPRPRVYINRRRPAESWSPDASPYLPPGEAPVMPSLAESLASSSVLPPPQPPAPGTPMMPLGASTEPRAWDYQPPQTIAETSQQSRTPGVANLGYDLGRALESMGVPADKAYDRGEDIKSILGVLPGTGSAMSLDQAKEDFAKGNYGSAAIDLVGAAPVPGAAAAKGAVKKGAKAVKEAVTGAAEGETKSVLATAGRAAKPREAATLKDAVVAAGQEADQITKSAKLPNLRDMDLPAAIEAARKEQHLGIRRADGGIEGAPSHVMSKDDVLAMRGSMDEAMQLGASVGGDKWYHEGRAFAKQAAGPDPVTQDITAKTLGLTSKQVNPDVNLGFTTKATNAYAAGRPAEILMDPKQADTYKRIRQGIAHDTKKTAQLGINVNPTVPFTTTGVNDIWHARSMGYANPDGSLWTGTPSGPMHRFMDHETVLAVDRANQMKLGGRDDWTAPDVQAAIWVGRKAQSDAMKRGEGNAAASAMAQKLQPGVDVNDMAAVNAAIKGGSKEAIGDFKGSMKPALTIEDALPNASKGYGDFAPKYTANASYEFTPGQGIAGHLQGLAYGDEALRKKFADLPANQWTFGENKDDALYNAAGMLQAKPTGTNQGIFSRGEGYPTELNPGFTAFPMTAMEGGSGKRVWDQNTSDLLHGIEGIRGYFDAQNASGAHQFVTNQPGRANSFVFDKSQPLTTGDLARFEAAGTKVGKPNMMDLPEQGVLTDWNGPGPGLTTKQETSLADEIAGITGGGVPRGERMERLSTDYNTLNRAPDWEQGEGSGAATRALMDIVSRAPALVGNIDRDPRLRKMIKDKMDAHEAWAIANNDPIRRDIQNAKLVFSQDGPAGGLAGLFAALKAGTIALPSIAAVGLALPMLTGGAPGAPQPSADRM
jgi:hypothetical protein